MRNNPGIAVSLIVAILLVVVFVDRLSLPADPSLRAGMSEHEVDEILKKSGCRLVADAFPLSRIYEQGPVGFANELRRVTVYFDNGRLGLWDLESFLPAWLGSH
jgi:hypothetical protein